MSILRWILVFPAALVARIAVQLVVGMALRAALSLSGVGIRESSVGFWAQLFIDYFVADVVFVIAGAKVAPESRSAAAVVLAILGSGLSLAQHVVGQHLAGNRVGTTNYLHFGLEAAGLLAGAVLIAVTERKRSAGDSRQAVAGH